jgi:hypothetical protein
MKTAVRFLIGFLAITGAVALLTHFGGLELGREDYWDQRGVFFLVFIAFFPRLTLLFSSVPFGGLLWWLGWIFAPRLLVAILATIAYWVQNPVLVLIAWLIALGGETTEKTMVVHRSRPRMRGFESAKEVRSEVV